jgi:hypothetical protein
VGNVGEDGIKANTAYRLDANNKFVEVPAPPKELAAQAG